MKTQPEPSPRVRSRSGVLYISRPPLQRSWRLGVRVKARDSGRKNAFMKHHEQMGFNTQEALMAY